MYIKSAYLLFVFSIVLSFVACSSDEMALSVGEGVVNDDHKAFYTENFSIESETLLASYVSTNNSGVALCGSYLDDYIGEITTNTVFKISPDLEYKEFSDKYKSAEYDSIAFVMFPSSYIYGDSTQVLNLSLHELTELFDLDTVRVVTDNGLTTITHKANNSLTDYDPVPLANISFIPEDTDSLITRLSDIIGEEWFDGILANDDDFTIGFGETDEDFIENVLNGLTVRSAGGNQAVIGFDMPTDAEPDVKAGMTIRMYFHTTKPYEELYIDFPIYEPEHQYNQISADFSTGVLDGIMPDSLGIPSAQTNGLSFIHSGLGLMTKITIPSLYELFLYGPNLTIIDLDLDFSVLPNSFSQLYPLPGDLSLQKLRANGQVNSSGLVDFSGQPVMIYQTKLSTTEAEFTAPITNYGWGEKNYLSAEFPEKNSLLLSTGFNGLYPPNINRMVIGDEGNFDAKMKVKMYYTTFD